MIKTSESRGIAGFLEGIEWDTWDVGRTAEKLVNHDSQASDLQAFRVFSQHPKWFYYASKSQESAFYCFYEITTENVRQRNRILFYFS